MACELKNLVITKQYMKSQSTQEQVQENYLKRVESV